MSCPQPAPFAFTQLTEPAQYANPSALPSGFNAQMALLMGNCCNLTYSQFASGSTDLTQAQLSSLGSFTQLAGFSISEAIATGAEIGTTGEWATFPVGFAITGTPSGGGQQINIIALRGTRTYNEWLNDAEAIPSPFHIGTNNDNYYNSLDIAQIGLVHGGFYNLYNQGTDGAQPVATEVKDLIYYEYSRPTGSIAQQIASLIALNTFDSSLPLYVTGHSLGAALATVCAADIGINFPNNFPSGQLYMYNLASPLVVAGVNAYGVGFDSQDFVTSYNNAVSNSYRIVHSPDIVPISPPSCIHSLQR